MQVEPDPGNHSMYPFGYIDVGGANVTLSASVPPVVPNGQVPVLIVSTPPEVFHVHAAHVALL